MVGMLLKETGFECGSRDCVACIATIFLIQQRNTQSCGVPPSSRILELRLRKQFLQYNYFINIIISPLGTPATIGLLYQPQMMVIVEELVE
jgi:hypothetical protein